MKARTRQIYQQRIDFVLAYIRRHLDDALSLDDLARVTHFSPYHFHRVFRAMVGESVQEHIRRLRLERAAHRLRRSDQPVAQVAFDAGYTTHESFSRAFRAMFGEAPSSFRRNHQPISYRDVPSGIHFRPDRQI